MKQFLVFAVALTGMIPSYSAVLSPEEVATKVATVLNDIRLVRCTCGEGCSLPDLVYPDPTLDTEEYMRIMFQRIESLPLDGGQCWSKNNGKDDFRAKIVQLGILRMRYALLSVLLKEGKYHVFNDSAERYRFNLRVSCATGL